MDKLVKKFLHSPVMHSVDDETSPVEAMTHHLFEVADADAKKDLVRALASGTGRRILFMRTKHHAKRLAKQLSSQGIPAVDLQGNLSQGAGSATSPSSRPARPSCSSTDVAARGVHVDHVELVVHVDPPTEHKAYLHRSGRTARAGSSGDVVTVTLPAERRDVAQMMRAAAIKVTPQQVTATSPAVTELVGEVAPIRHVEEAPVQQQRQRQPRAAESGHTDSAGGGRRRGRGGRSGGSTQAPEATSAGRGSGRAAGGRGGRPAAAGASASAGAAGRAGGAGRGNGSGAAASGGATAVSAVRAAAVGRRATSSVAGPLRCGRPRAATQRVGPVRVSPPAVVAAGFASGVASGRGCRPPLSVGGPGPEWSARATGRRRCPAASCRFGVGVRNLDVRWEQQQCSRVRSPSPKAA